MSESRRLVPAWLLVATLIVIVVITVAVWALAALQQVPPDFPASEAWVAGTRYHVGVAIFVQAEADDLIEYATIERTNAQNAFADATAFRLQGVDPLAALVAPNHPRSGDRGDVRLLWGPRQDEAFPQLCPYLPTDHRQALDACP